MPALQDRDNEPIVQMEDPEFLAGPLDGELVPVARRTDRRIHCEMAYPWSISDSPYGTYAYEREESGDFLFCGHHR